MTQYKYQTNPAFIVGGELGVSGGQLVVGAGAEGSTSVVGNPANSTAVAALTPSYAEEQMDIASAQTLGSGFVFLNGTGFDSMGVGLYEFEESNGFVYGLYGRTDGVAQQVYYSGATSNTQVQQYTTVPYVPSFLSGNNWQAAVVCGSDLLGFTLGLRDTTNATLTLRYIYVRHGGSLINTSGHEYVEITSIVSSYMSSVSHVSSAVPRVVRVGDYFFIALGDWQFGALWIGGWNAQDSTFPFTQAALPASSPTYNPTQFTITTNGLPGGDITTAETFPAVLGSASNFNLNQFRIYNASNGQVTTPVFLNAPEPINAGWSTNMGAILEGETDGSGNPFLALGALVVPGDVNGLAVEALIVNSIAVQFTAGSAGAFTSAQLNYVTAGNNGSDLFHNQAAPFYLSSGLQTPNEAVQSNPATPTTCISKLPVASWFAGLGHWDFQTLSPQWYYSGTVAFSAFGSGAVVRGLSRPAGNQSGGYSQAKANKLSMLYPMFNVTNRADFNTTSGTAMQRTFTIPSGQMSQNYWGRFVGPSLIFSQALDDQNNAIQTISVLPAGTQVGDVTYNRFGTSVPGMRPRIAEYLVNLPSWNSTLSTWGCVWPVGIADINSPLVFQFPACTDSGPFASNSNGGAVRLGHFTLSGNVYQPPPVVWNYASNMLTQLAALKASVVSTTQAAHSDFGSGAVFGIEVVPVINSAGNGIAFALGVVSARNAANTQLQTSFFMTPCGLSGTTVNLTNTSSVTLINYSAVTVFGAPGTYSQNDSLAGSMNVVYPATAGGNFYVQWSTGNSPNVAGDSEAYVSITEFTSANAVVSNGGINTSKARSMMSCAAQHQGLAIIPVRDNVNIPEVDIPLSRFTTSAVSAQGDFAASFAQAITNPQNQIPGDPQSRSYNVTEMMTLQSISNQFLLQLGSINGRMNHKQFSLPATFLDLTSSPVGTYYLYLTDTGSGGIQVQFDTAQRPESATSMYFGTFQRTSTGFSNESSISEVIRFGTARLVAGTNNTAMQGSQIRIGPYAG